MSRDINTSLESILAFCNHVRADFNLPPAFKLEKGVRKSSRSCPVARTIDCGVEVDSTGVHKRHERIEDGVYRKEVPIYVLNFIIDFDQGHYPELEQMMNILVCGGRDFNDAALMERILAPYKDQEVTIITGLARGADTLAKDWAFAHRKKFQGFPADWDKYGPGAGPIRNQQMLDEGHPDLVIAFPGGDGTADMTQRARAAGVRVVFVQMQLELEKLSAQTK